MKNNNHDPENAYWLRGVEGPQRRGELILWFLDLMDKYYQEKNWIYTGMPPRLEKYYQERKLIYTTIPGGQESFDAEISFAADMIFNELFMDEYIEKDKLPLDRIGLILKDEKEAKALFEAAEVLESMLENLPNASNKAYLESDYLILVRRASLDAFRVFMKNEKDNEKFCNFILNIIKKERNFFDIKFDKNKLPYQSILDYVKKCEEVLGLK